MGCCGPKALKILFFVSNGLFALAALAFAVAGLVNLLDMKNSGLYEFETKVAGIVAAAVGVAAAATAGLGCYGGFWQNRDMLITYSTLLLILIILTTTFGPLTWIYYGFQSQWHSILEAKFQTRGTENDLFLEIEQNMQCCGLIGSYTYHDNPPLSCCSEGAHSCTPQTAYEGCIFAVQVFFEIYRLIFSFMSIGLVAVELLAATCGICFTVRVCNRYKARVVV